MLKKNFEVISHYDNLPIKGFILEPDVEKKGIVQILHGMIEFKERYLPFAKYLCTYGYVVACIDQRGHGESVLSEADWGWFKDTEGEAFVEDAKQVSDYLKAEYPNLPLTLLGHSMGSMIVRCYTAKYDDNIDKLIVCGSPSKNPMVGAGIVLAKLLGKIKGERHHSKLLYNLSSGSFEKKFKEEGRGAWLSHNRENIMAFRSQPKGSFRFTCNGFENLFKLMKKTYQRKLYQVKNPKLPIYFISGDCDVVASSTVAWLKSVDFMMEVGYENVTCKAYKGLRHEILNELERKEVYEDVLAFLNGELELQIAEE